MNSQNLIGDNSLEFLKQYKTESEILSLLSGEQIPIQKYFLHFDPWKGDPIPNTYNGKAVIYWNGKPVFAELAVLRLFQSHGWDGVWVDSYRRKYRTGLPDVAEPVKLPEAQQKIIDAIRAKIGKSGGCWDVFVWNGGRMIFMELKRSKKDSIQNSQLRWLDASLEIGFSPDDFALVEWEIV